MGKFPSAARLSTGKGGKRINGSVENVIVPENHDVVGEHHQSLVTTLAVVGDGSPMVDIGMVQSLDSDSVTVCGNALLKRAVWINLILGIPITIWLIIGGYRDIHRCYERLRRFERDDRDDGNVVGHHLADESENT